MIEVSWYIKIAYIYGDGDQYLMMWGFFTDPVYLR